MPPYIETRTAPLVHPVLAPKTEDVFTWDEVYHYVCK